EGPEPRPEPPVYLFLDEPTDLDALLERLGRPDFVLKRGVDAVPERGPAVDETLTAPVVEAVAVDGEVRENLAYLAIEFRVAVQGTDPQWVPLRMDGLTLSGVTEAEDDLPCRVGKDGGWQVELAGKGVHRVRVALLAPVKATNEGRRLEVAIPEAASTRLALEVPAGAMDPLLGGKDPVEARAIEDQTRTRLRANLSPRRRLDLTWRVQEARGSQGPLMLVAQGAIAVDVEHGSLKTVSSWSIRSDRGAADALRMALDPAEEILSVELSGRAVPLDGLRDGDLGVLTIPLVEPLRPGTARGLIVTTRRSLPDGGEPVELRGLSMADAVAQSGVVAVAASSDLWVRGTAGRGLRPIDPKSDLPPDLRARPRTVLAYQFFEQPFGLTLRVDPSPPWIRVESRATLWLEPGRAQSVAWLDYLVSRGRVFDVQVRLPDGLELESVGPDTVVESLHERPEVIGDPEQTARVLTLRLTPRARDDGDFRIRLVARQNLDADGAAALALFQPLGATSRGGKLAVVAARNIVADLSEQGRDRGMGAGFTPSGPDSLNDWPRVLDQGSAPSTPSLWLRYDGTPATLPVTVSVFPQSIRHQTLLSAQLDRRTLDVRQETTLQVRHGALNRVEVVVPRSIEGRWDLEGDEVSSRELLGVEADGDLRYRLVLSREATDAVPLRFRYRLFLEPGLAADQARRLEIPYIRPVEGEAQGIRVQVYANDAVQVSDESGHGWTATSERDGPTASGVGVSVGAGGLPLRLTLLASPEAGKRPAVVLAKALALAPLPTLVATRLWLRTYQTPEGGLIASATYRVETHGQSFDVALPAGADLAAAMVNNDPATVVERRAEPGGYRITFPASSAPGVAVVQLDYTMPAARAERGWGPPGLLEGGVVQQTFWEARVPWNRAIVGTPDGWTDENDWRWAAYVWKRRPNRDPQALAAWILPGPLASSLAADAPGDPRGDSSRYLFGRPGNPPLIQPTVASRAGLVAIYSGLVLGLGVVLLIYRPPGRLVRLTALGLILAVAVAVEPSVTLLAVQSSVVGVALVVLAAVTQRLVEGRRLGGPLRLEPSGLGGSGLPGSSRQILLGSDPEESTVIRPRPGTTVDHQSLPAKAEGVERRA
ncbi:MAG: hypothetical protein ABI353_01950, partial [Isosphaeraceae bacterium]